MALTKKEIRRRFYLRHKDKVIQWVRKYEEEHKNDPEFKKKKAEYHKKWRKKNYSRWKRYNTLMMRIYRKKQIKNHKWFCKVHKLKIGEGYNCPKCETEKLETMIRR